MMWIGITLFAATLAALEWLGNGRVTWLPLQALIAFAVLRMLGRTVPWDHWAVRRWPNRLAMFILFVRHFARIAGEESARTMRSWRVAAPRLAGPEGFSSLGHAVAAVLTKSLTRAERFYAGLRMQGIDG